MTNEATTRLLQLLLLMLNLLYFSSATYHLLQLLLELLTTFRRIEGHLIIIFLFALLVIIIVALFSEQVELLNKIVLRQNLSERYSCQRNLHMLLWRIVLYDCCHSILLSCEELLTRSLLQWGEHTPLKHMEALCCRWRRRILWLLGLLIFKF